MESTFWEDPLNRTIKCEGGNAGSSSQVKEDQLFRYCEGNLNFATVPSEDDDYGYHKKKLSRDPLSHRIIEKRRRDRMNNCLADLSRLLPSEYMKKGRGRVEKTEIIEMAIRHMKELQEGGGGVHSHSQGQPEAVPSSHQYRLGFHECLTEALHFLVEVEGFFPGDTLCLQLVSHLHRHADTLLKGDSRRSESGSSGGSNGKEEMGCDSEKLSSPESLPSNPASESNPSTNGHSYSPSSTCSEPQASYKFKNSIRKRFATERRVAQRGGGAAGSPGGGTGPPGGTSVVPVFALSSKGSYYVPLSLDYALLAPHLPASGPGSGPLDPDQEEEDEPVLHPVTISVNFRPA